ncbi:MAG: cytidylate kinase-like family protein [Desulfobacterales bacterium]|nr:cytidylate kinase-like family protein [Desulfobacterales bacterium]
MAILTISRMFGSGARELGEIIAQRLGYSFFDHELIQMVAEQAKLSEEWVTTMEQTAGVRFQKFLATLVPRNLMEIIQNAEYGERDEEIYADMLNQVIRKIAAEGDAIILGRGGQYILKDHPDTYHALLVADLDYRINHIRQRFELTKKQALLAVAMEDKRRVNLYRKLGKADYDQADHYHITLNMRLTEVKTAGEMLCAMLATGRSSSD